MSTEVEAVESVTEQVADGVEVLDENTTSDSEACHQLRASLLRCISAIAATMPIRYEFTADGVKLVIPAEVCTTPRGQRSRSDEFLHQ